MTLVGNSQIEPHVHVRIKQKEFAGLYLFVDFALDILEGETLVVLGPSGSGKTTLLRLICGLDQDYTGTIEFPGSPYPLGNVGYVFQDVRLFPWMTVAQNIRFADRQGSVSKERIDQLLSLVGLDERASRLYPQQLSGGMGKRVALARALAHRPALLLLDEPFSDLDARSKYAMYETLIRYKFQQDPPMTILLVTHDLDEAAYLSDRIIILSDGRPARLVREFKVPLPQPRKRSDPAYLSLCTELMVQIISDVDRELTKE